MKKHNVGIIFIALILILGLVGCGASNNSGSNADAAFEKHTIPYPEGYVTDQGGGSAYNGAEDHFDTSYWKPQDVYNMKTKDSLTAISEFETYQQSTEYTCGAATSVMVLNHYGVTNYDELTIAKLSSTSDETGVGVDGLAKFFDGIGWDVQRSKAGEMTFDYNKDPNAPVNWSKWVIKNLAEGTPVMVDWLDWAGHWQAIIAYDTMGTDDDIGDDVMIVADPYDTSDHYQDGYYTIGAERFFYMWEEGVTVKDEPEPQPWIIAKPKQETSTAE